MKPCPYCKEPIQDEAIICKHCKIQLHGNSSGTIVKDKGFTIVLAIFLGGIGMHKFYIGKNTQGIFYLLFCWTFIPVIISFFEVIRYLIFSEEQWHNYINS